MSLPHAQQPQPREEALGDVPGPPPLTGAAVQPLSWVPERRMAGHLSGAHLTLCTQARELCVLDQMEELALVTIAKTPGLPVK